MKKISHNITILLLLLAAISIFPQTLWAQEQTPEIVLSVDYVEQDLEIPVSPDGGTATLHIVSYGGIPEETLLSNIQSSLEALSISWITNVYLTNKEGIYEADLNFDISSNFTDQARELIVSASNGSSTITQGLHTPNVYNLLPNVNTVRLLHGGTNALILSSSDGFASYRLLKDSLNYTITVADVNGKSEGNRQLKFIINSPGTYYCIAYYPTEVQMNGTKTVDWHLFYSDTRNCSLNPNPYTFSKDGGKVTFTYNVSSAQDSILQRIVNFYNSGNCTIWDTTMNLSYNRLSSTQVRITVEAGPNLKKVQVYPPQPNTISNNTFFKNFAGNELVFTQPAGGEIKAYNVSFPGNMGSVPPYLILDSTQCKVRYAIFKNGEQYGPARMGHGDSLHLSVPADSGKFTVVAFYGGKARAMKGTLTITGNMKAVWGDNWILKQTFTAGSGAFSNLDITYFDGLGYQTQVISVGASPSGKNIITPIWYDPMRRDDAKAYLPYASTTSSTPQPENNPFQNQSDFYTNLYGQSDAQFAFAEKIYEASPLNRVQRQFTPGQAFRTSGTGSGGNDHYTAFSYEANSANEILDISCADNGSLTVKGYIAAAKLFKTTVTSPDGRTTTEFKDSDGTLLLQRSGTGNSIQETYYAYDSRRRLRWVIQPEGTVRIKNLAANSSNANPYSCSQGDSTAKMFCFIYAYDGLGRMTEKRIPGKGFEYMVYDPAGRLVAMQDSILRSQNNNWLLTRYDSLSRVTSTFRSVQRTRQQMVSAFAASPYPSIYGQSGNILLTKAEYGSTAPSNLAFAQVTGVVTTADKDSRTKGLLTYDKTLDLTTQSLAENQRKYRERAYYYDAKGRVIQTVEKLPDGEILRTSVKYDFVGNPLTTVQTLNKGTNSTIEDNTGISQDGSNSLTQVFTYDTRGRKLTSAAYLNSISDTYSAANYSYDELGRLINTETGKTATQGSAVLSPSTTTPVLSNALSYNIQGWMTAQTDLLKKGAAQSTHKSLYSQTLRYHDAAKASTTKSYDGLITEWETIQFSNGTDFTAPGSTQNKSTYAFTYDTQGRLTQSARFAADASTSDYSFTERNLSYDRNGNILSLTRYGQSASTARDNFTYFYSGNRIEKLSGTLNGQTITHTVQNSQVSGTADYTYDGNGNMTYDALRHIAMTYDINNLVSTVSRNDSLLSTYTYLADGTKYKIVDNNGNGRYYTGPFCLAIEKTGTGTGAQTKAYLESIDTDSGRILAIREQTGTAYTTAFFTRDHLGSVRAVTDAQGNILERNAYYPFGLQNSQNLAFPTIPSSLATLYPNSISSVTARRDLYNGKEIQATAGTDYIDYGFRQYDPVTARWMAIDPMAVEHKSISPYVYCQNNSIVIVDVGGLDGVISSGSGTKDDPFIVTAVYFYTTGSLEKDEIDSFQSALDEYNSDIYKTKKGYYKFNLSMKAVEKKDLTSEMEKTEIFDEDDEKKVYYGNYIHINEEDDSKYGGGDCREVILYRRKISEGKNKGMNLNNLLKGVIIHELGHNLGGTHDDGTSTMSMVLEDVRDNAGNRGKTDYSVYPSLKKNFIIKILNKIGKKKIHEDDGKIWEKQESGIK
ncbi:MAG: metallopeptidase family protein [Bacteroidales bacterium]|nr:metallopeptidase family protein [Bacteroidales bacterium]